jgi:hypothetical protein
MKNQLLGAFGVAIALFSVRAHAQEDDAMGENADESADSYDGADSDAEEEAEDDSDAKMGVGFEASAKADADGAGAEAEADAEADADAKGPGKADKRASGENARRGIPRRAPRYGDPDDWLFVPYGYARLDAIRDSTQSFNDGINPFLIQRAGTYLGDHPRSTFTARDSRLGFYVGAPEFEGMTTYAQIELDFFGIVPTETREHDATVFGPVPFARLSSSSKRRCSTSWQANTSSYSVGVATAFIQARWLSSACPGRSFTAIPNSGWKSVSISAGSK